MYLACAYIYMYIYIYMITTANNMRAGGCTNKTSEQDLL